MKRAFVLAFALALAAPAAAQEAPAAPVIGLEVDLGLLHRSLRYNDDLYGFFRPYTLGSALTVGYDATSFPLAASFEDWAGQPGISVRGDATAGLVSRSSDGTEYETRAGMLEVLGLYRHDLGPVGVQGEVGWGRDQFQFDATAPAGPTGSGAPNVPNVNYGYVRVGLSAATVLAERLTLQAGAAYLAVLDSGGLQNSDVWFPNATTAGIALEGSASVLLGQGISLVGRASGRRYGSSMNPTVDDGARIVGGSIDRFIRASVGLRWER